VSYRTARLIYCICGKQVWSGLDADRCAGEARADVREIDQDAVEVCFANGIKVYALDTHRHLWRLDDPQHGYRITLRAHNCPGRAS
jgi:hypothetical protein